jgi:hypothetical protein
MIVRSSLNRVALVCCSTAFNTRRPISDDALEPRLLQRLAIGVLGFGDPVAVEHEELSRLERGRDRLEP